MILPDLDHPESIFDIHPPPAWVKDDLVTIEFLIPLAYKGRFSAAVITTPDHQNFTWDLGTAVPFRGLFMGPGKNDKFFFEDDAIETLPGFFETKLVRSGPSCAR